MSRKRTRSPTELVLELNVLNCEDPSASDAKFWLCCEMLLSRALPAHMAQEIAEAIGEQEIGEAQLGHWKIDLVREELLAGIGESYERVFAVKLGQPSMPFGERATNRVPVLFGCLFVYILRRDNQRG